jgi:hypothetical protein
LSLTLLASVLDDDQNFMQEDEDMITIMDSDRFIDSIRLLTCKYRIMHSTPEWLSNFCTSGGDNPHCHTCSLITSDGRHLCLG